MNNEYVMLPLDITTVLYSNTLKFTVESSGETIEYNKLEIDVGRDALNDYTLEDKSLVARKHATFLYENQMWFLRDNGSTNGTYINGKRLEPWKKYQLASNDVVSFANEETVVFDKHVKKKSESNCFVIGDRFADRYIILEKIGQSSYFGSFDTYLVLDEKLNKQWAMKVCYKSKLGISAALRAFVFQSQMLMKCDHPAIPRVINFIEDDKKICIIWDYIEGKTLSTVLSEEGTISEQTVIDWAIQLCQGLRYLHSLEPPLIYRDMKPANVVLQTNGGVKLIDFGAAIVYDEHSLYDEFVIGTRGYAAPEQYCGKSDPRTDIYGLGMTLHHLVTGVDPVLPPYECKPIREINTGFSRELEAIILRCTEPDPSNRFQNCDELLVALQGGPIYPPRQMGLLRRLLFGKRALKRRSKR